MTLRSSPHVTLVARITLLVVIAGVGLWLVGNGSWSEQRRLERLRRQGETELEELQEFLVAGWAAAERAASLDIGTVRRWIPTSFSPHEQKARLLECAGAAGLWVHELSLGSASLPLDAPWSPSEEHDGGDSWSGSADLLPEELAHLERFLEPSEADDDWWEESEPEDAGPVLMACPATMRGEASVPELLDWLSRIKAPGPATVVTSVQLERIEDTRVAGPVTRAGSTSSTGAASRGSQAAPRSRKPVAFTVQLLLAWRQAAASEPETGRAEPADGEPAAREERP